ncbi:UDP-N-acetylmuramoylpentapeptide-lysine N(6)-alanyltransferase [Oenococcus oeni]|uniref:lipid II:glycine glycyltransferase FemX n=1 Tax=Oenococcus oeni TaxID=1247 RepID=UPI0010B2CA7C|nr:peptidoglycan bridge formation glycyltransferase FemA/FemB family protein [Oenococcus oeni]SYW05772.1 UDP-N-acetylmuramoylpentapeptide-lysine N(6)-alanyltransferase [Oenococcus oeni]
MILDLNDEAAVKKYNDFVRTNWRGQATQDTLWGALKANWGHLYVYHENESGQIDAAMAVLTIEAVPEKLLAYSPRGPIADFENIELVDSLVNEALEALPNNVFLLRMDPEVIYDQDLNDKYQAAGYQTRNVQIKSMHGNIQPRKNMVLSYKDIKNEDDLMTHFKRDYRTQIRHAIKDGMTVDFGHSREFVGDFYETYVMMANAQQITYRPKEYFYRMSDLFASTGLFKIFLAHFQGHIVASGIGFAHGDEIWYMYAGSDRKYSKHYGPYLLQWEMTKWGLSLQKAEYDFGGVGAFDPSDGLYRFKHGFTYKDAPREYIGEVDKVLDKDAYDKYLLTFNK